MSSALMLAAVLAAMALPDPSLCPEEARLTQSGGGLERRVAAILAARTAPRQDALAVHHHLVGRPPATLSTYLVSSPRGVSPALTRSIISLTSAISCGGSCPMSAK